MHALPSTARGPIMFVHSRDHGDARKHGDDQMIKAIKFANIPVTDQDRALEFYTKKLGLRVITDSPFNNQQRWIELGIPRAETKLVLFTAPGQDKLIGGLMNVTFSADDVEATAREMKARGVEFVQEPQKADWGTSAIFKDPDGNQFVLSTP
jgi:catechol 2,3-dioxygenase-like lactoylglutathione lyase family enzyme